MNGSVYKAGRPHLARKQQANQAEVTRLQQGTFIYFKLVLLNFLSCNSNFVTFSVQFDCSM
jgi:hypothetical protein